MQAFLPRHLRQALVLSLFTLALLSTPATLSHAADSSAPPIEYGYPDVSVWTTKRNTEGQLENPLLKLADVIFGKAGIKWQSKPYPARRLFKHLKEGAIPFTMLVRASSLKECCLFSTKPVTSTELRVYRKESTASIKAKEDFIGKRVITIRGYSYGSLGKFIRDKNNKVSIQEANGHDAAFELFERNRGDYIIDYTGPAAEVLEARPISDVTSDIFKQLDVFLVLSKSYPNAQKVLSDLEKIAEDIDIQSILKRK